MIYKKCVMTIDKNKATLDEDIYLYRLDKNIELYFTIVNNKYRFNKGDMNNIILITNASFFQVRLYKNAEIKYTFAIQPTDGGQAILTITDDLIDDPIEVGDYDFQISLLDEEKTSMISMPIVSKQLHVCEPLVSDDATMGKAILGLSKLATGEIKNAFDSDGNYIREIHKDGDILSASIINKFEEALDTNTKAIKNGTGTPYDDTAIKNDITGIKTDLGTETLNTTAKDIKGAVNEVAAQYKDIEKKIYYVTPQYFGAKADGVTDDTTFIKTAITYCINNSVVLKMHGTYKTSETLVFTGEFKLIAKNVKIIYSGADYAIRITNSTNADIEIDEIHSMNGGCIEIYSSSNENYVQYLTLKGKELQSKNKCIFFNVTGGWANQNTIENFKLQSGEYGVYADAKDVDCINGISFYNVGVEGVNTGFYIANSAQCWSLINIRHLESYKTFIETVGKVTINIVGYSYFYFGRDAEVKLSNKTSGSIISPIIKDDGVILDYYAEIVDGTVIPNNYRAYLNIYDHANTVLTKEQFYNYFLANNVSSSLELSKAYGCYNGINEFIIKCDFDNGTNFIVYDYNKNIIFNNTVDTGWSSLKFQWFAEVGWKIEKISYITNLKASS